VGALIMPAPLGRERFDLFFAQLTDLIEHPAFARAVVYGRARNRAFVGPPLGRPAARMRIRKQLALTTQFTAMTEDDGF
jgi:hypothetical protein